MRPRTGLPQVEDRAREARIVSTVTASVLTILHPRTIFSVNLQEMQDDGCLESACINASCLALLDASVSLKFLIASVRDKKRFENFREKSELLNTSSYFVKLEGLRQI